MVVITIGSIRMEKNYHFLLPYLLLVHFSSSFWFEWSNNEMNHLHCLPLIIMKIDGWNFWRPDLWLFIIIMNGSRFANVYGAHRRLEQAVHNKKCTVINWLRQSVSHIRFGRFESFKHRTNASLHAIKWILRTLWIEYWIQMRWGVMRHAHTRNNVEFN